MPTAATPDNTQGLMAALLANEWDAAEDFAASGGAFEIPHGLNHEALSWLRLAVTAPRRPALASAIVKARPHIGHSLTEAAVVWGDYRDVVPLIEAGVEPSLRLLCNCPARSKADLLDLLLKHGANPAANRSEALAFVGRPMFGTLLAAGANLVDALESHASLHRVEEVTHLIEEAWRIGRASKKILETTRKTWHACTINAAPEPAILQNRLTTLARMESIDIDLCDAWAFDYCAGLPQIAINARLVDWLTEGRLTEGGVYAFMKSGADLSYNDHEPLRAAAARGNRYIFQLLLRHDSGITNYDSLLEAIARARAPSPETCTQLMGVLLPHLDSIDYHGGRPLFYAVLHDNADLAESLLKAGADPWASSPFLPDCEILSLVDLNEGTRMARLFRDKLAESAVAAATAQSGTACEKSGATPPATSGSIGDAARRRPR